MDNLPPLEALYRHVDLQNRAIYQARAVVRAISWLSTQCPEHTVDILHLLDIADEKLTAAGENLDSVNLNKAAGIGPIPPGPRLVVDNTPG